MDPEALTEAKLRRAKRAILAFINARRELEAVREELREITRAQQAVSIVAEIDALIGETGG